MAKYIIKYANLFAPAVRYIISGIDRGVYTQSYVSKVFDKFNGVLNCLAENPYIGSKELFLDNLVLEYRKIIIKPYFKIIYTILDDKEVVIYLLWDCRQDPQKLVDTITSYLSRP